MPEPTINGVEVSATEYFLDPEEYPPPKGKKLNLLTKGGIACQGTWSGEDLVGWAPLHRIPAKLKERMKP